MKVTLDDDAERSLASDDKNEESPRRKSPRTRKARNRDMVEEEEDNLLDDKGDGSQPDSKSEEEKNIEKMTVIDEINDENRSEVNY